MDSAALTSKAALSAASSARFFASLLAFIVIAPTLPARAYCRLNIAVSMSERRKFAAPVAQAAILSATTSTVANLRFHSGQGLSHKGMLAKIKSPERQVRGIGGRT